MDEKKYPLNLELPWVEKYRPEYLRDVVGNVETINALKRIAQDGNLPHMILSGLPGIGKTTAVLCLARELFNNDEKLMKEAVLELNASDDRGIDIVRNMIKKFAQKKVLLPYNRHKIIILDEADSITASAQQALRRTMEIYSNTTRFNKLKDDEILANLKRVLEGENIKEYTDDGLGALIFTADGDMRQAVNNLQSVYYGFGIINQENVFKLVDMPNPMIVRQMLVKASKGEVDDALAVLKSVFGKGYSAVDIVNVCFRVSKTMQNDLGGDTEKVLRLLKTIGECQMRVVEGVATYLQLSAMVATIADL